MSTARVFGRAWACPSCKKQHIEAKNHKLGDIPAVDTYKCPHCGVTYDIVVSSELACWTRRSTLSSEPAVQAHAPT